MSAKRKLILLTQGCASNKKLFMLLAERSGDVQAPGAGPTSHHHRVYTQLCSAAKATPSGTLSTEQANAMCTSVQSNVHTRT